MKTLRYYIMMAAVLLMAGCTDDSDIDKQAAIAGDMVEITVGMPETRISYDDADDIRPFAWEEGDVVIAAGFDGADAFKGTSEFGMGTASGGTATFCGKLIQGAEKYVLYYKSAKLTIDESGKAAIDYAAQTENAADATAHIRDYMLMASDIVTAADMLDGESEKTLILKNSMVRLDVRSFPESVGQLDEIELTANEGTAESTSAKIAISNAAAAAPFKVYMMFDPDAMAQKAGNTFRVAFRGTATYSVKKTGSNAMLDKSGMRYNLIIFQNEQLEEGRKGLNEWTEMCGLNEIDAVSHRITTIMAGSLTSEALAKAAGDSKTLVVEGMLNGADVKVLREAAGCPFNSNGNPQVAIITSLDMTNAELIPGNEEFATGFLGKRFTITASNSLPEAIFYKSGLQTIKMPKSISIIERDAFCNSADLKEITIDANSLGNYVFAGCTNLSVVNWGSKTPSKLSDNLFENCTSLKSITIPVTVTEIGPSTFYGSGLQEIIIPSNVKTIEESAFMQSQLTSCTIPETVTAISKGIFCECSLLTSLTIACDKQKVTFLEGSNPGADFLGLYENSKNIDFKLHPSFAEDITWNAEGQIMFLGYPCKSITDLEGNPFTQDNQAAEGTAN